MFKVKFMKLCNESNFISYFINISTMNIMMVDAFIDHGNPNCNPMLINLFDD